MLHQLITEYQSAPHYMALGTHLLYDIQKEQHPMSIIYDESYARNQIQHSIEGTLNELYKKANQTS